MANKKKGAWGREWVFMKFLMFALCSLFCFLFCLFFCRVFEENESQYGQWTDQNENLRHSPLLHVPHETRNVMKYKALS